MNENVLFADDVSVIYLLISRDLRYSFNLQNTFVNQIKMTGSAH